LEKGDEKMSLQVMIILGSCVALIGQLLSINEIFFCMSLIGIYVGCDIIQMSLKKKELKK